MAKWTWGVSFGKRDVAGDRDATAGGFYRSRGRAAMTGDRPARFLAALANAHRLFQNETALRGMLFILLTFRFFAGREDFRTVNK